MELGFEQDRETLADAAGAVEGLKGPAGQAVVVIVTGGARACVLRLDMQRRMRIVRLAMEYPIRNRSQPHHQQVEEQGQKRGAATPGARIQLSSSGWER